MIVLAVFLHTALVISLGPLLAGVIRLAARGGGLQALLAPGRFISEGLRAPGQPPYSLLAMLALAVLAGLLIPLFSSDAVLGFLGDGFVALLLLAGLSARLLPLRAPSVLAVAAGLWTIGTLTGSTDLAQALADWKAGPATILVFLGLALAVAPLLSDAPASEASPTLSAALEAWIRSTLQLGWLALASMAFPWSIPLADALTFAAALALFALTFLGLGALLAAVSARWPKLPAAELGFACSLCALALVKLGI